MSAGLSNLVMSSDERIATVALVSSRTLHGSIGGSNMEPLSDASNFQNAGSPLGTRRSAQKTAERGRRKSLLQSHGKVCCNTRYRTCRGIVVFVCYKMYGKNGFPSVDAARLVIGLGDFDDN